MSARALSPALAYAVAAAGIGLFSVMDAFMKSLVLAIGVYNAVFWRTLISSGLGAVAWRLGGGGMPSPRVLRLHLLRGCLAAGMTMLFFWGLGRVPMAQAIALSYIAPLIALLLAALVLHEQVSTRVIVASLVALGGVGVILAGQSRAVPQPGALEGAVAILASAVLYAGNLVVARVQAQAAGPGEIAFFQSTTVAVILGAAAPWLAVVPEAAQWPKIVAGAVLASGSLYLLGWAYAHGETGRLATTEYTSFLYAAALGWLVFGEPVSPWTLAGAAVIAGACVVAARRRDVTPQSVEAAA